MVALPIEAFVGGEPAAQIAYVTDWLPSWWNGGPAAYPHPHVAPSASVRSFVASIPGETIGYSVNVPPVIVEITIADSSALGRFRAEVITGLSTYQYNGRPGTPFTDNYVGWKNGWSGSRLEYPHLGWVDCMSQMYQMYTGTPAYYVASWTNIEVSSFRGVGNEPEAVMDVGFTITTNEPWNNPLLNPALAGGGGGSERPDDGLLYPRKV